MVSKVVACGLPLYRVGRRNMLKVGVGMTPRGKVAMIVALIGLQMNVISQRSYALVIIMAAVTTVLPPPFLKMLLRRNARAVQPSGRRSANIQPTQVVPSAAFRLAAYTTRFIILQRIEGCLFQFEPS